MPAVPGQIHRRERALPDLFLDLVAASKSNPKRLQRVDRSGLVAGRGSVGRATRAEALLPTIIIDHLAGMPVTGPSGLVVANIRFRADASQRKPAVSN